MSRFVLAAALVALPAAAAAQQSHTTVTAPVERVVISYADLDIATAPGARALKRRIAGAVEEVCGSYANAKEWSEDERVTLCRNAAWQSADRQLKAHPDQARLALVIAR